MRSTVFLVLFVTLALPAASSLSGCAPRPHPVAPPWQEEVGPPQFSAEDRRLIRDYFRQYEYPPSLTHPSAMASGLEARIERFAVLPPDLGADSLPPELEQRLSPLPGHYARFRVVEDAVLMDLNTREVVDIVREVGP